MKRTTMILAGSWLVAGPARAECSEPVPVSRLAQDVSAADAAFANMDDTSYYNARNAVLSALPCADAPLSASQAAALYRMLALGTFLDGDHPGTVSWFRALLAVAPGYQLPDDIAPEGNPLRLDFEVAGGLPRARTDALPEPQAGQVLVDGEPASEVPTDRPYLFQYVDESGAVATTRLVQAGMSPPEYPSRPARAREGVAVNVPLAVVAGVSAVAAGGLYLAAAEQESQFWDSKTAAADLDAYRSRANTLGALSAGVGVVAVGSGAAAVLVGSW